MCRRIFALLIVILISFSIGCKPKEVLKIKKPDLLLTEDQMQRIFVDAQLIEGALNYKRNKGTVIKEVKNEYYEKMFITYGITEVVFEENVAYYNQFPQVMEKIYDEVLADLSKTQSLIKPQTDE